MEFDVNSGVTFADAVLWGLRIAALPTILVGTFFAISLTMDSMISSPFKLFGWFFGPVIGLVSGSLIGPNLMPILWPWVGTVLCAGFGWSVTWATISFIGRPQYHSWIDGLRELGRGGKEAGRSNAEQPRVKRPPLINVTPKKRILPDDRIPIGRSTDRHGGQR